MTPVEGHYWDELRLGTQRLKAEINYNPRGFNRMVGEYGPREASRRLIQADGVSDGFTTLWQAERLEMTVEALALLPWYEPLFTDDDRQRARHRLEQYQFDIEDFLSRRTAAPPSWVGSGEAV
jgi:hypothetical protein